MTKIQHAPPANYDPELERLITLAKRLEHGERISIDSLSSALYRAAARSYHSLAEKFLKAGADATTFAVQFTSNGGPRRNQLTAVHRAVLNGDVQMINLFAKYKVDFYKPLQHLKNAQTAPSGNALEIALENGKTAAAHALLDNGFDILHPCHDLENKPSAFLLSRALIMGESTIALRMIEHLPDACQLHKGNLLAEAADAGLCDAVTALLNKGTYHGQPFNINEISYAATRALRSGQVNCLHILTDAGADPNLFCTLRNRPDEDIAMNVTLFHCSITSPQENLAMKENFVRHLLQLGADPKIKTRDDNPRDAVEMAQKEFKHLLPLLSQAKSLREAFLVAKAQPAIDKIYQGGDNPLKIPQRKPQP